MEEQIQGTWKEDFFCIPVFLLRFMPIMTGEQKILQRPEVLLKRDRRNKPPIEHSDIYRLKQERIGKAGLQCRIPAKPQYHCIKNGTAR